MTTNMNGSLRPVPAIAGGRAYQVPRAGAPVDLRLDGNEGARPSARLLDALVAAGPAALRDYPDAAALQALLARRLGVTVHQVIVTAGADEAIDRACRAVLAPGREAILPEPGFEMTERYVALSRASAVRVPWPGGPYPTDEVCARIGPRTSMIVVTSPNNPTGAVAAAGDLLRLSAAAPHALLLVDLAYTEFADADLTRAALALPNAVVLRTFSKARGLAGLRVGWAAGPAQIITWLRQAGAPYSVPGPSLVLATASLDGEEEESSRQFVERVRAERRSLTASLTRLGAHAHPSQANFVLFETRDALWLRDAMAGLGIGVRAFPRRRGLECSVRIACPGAPRAFSRLQSALETVLAPAALLLDIDGVLADASDSYRTAIVETCHTFAVDVSHQDIAAAKRAGDASDDWALTAALLRSRGIDAPIEDVTQVFERLYQGTPDAPGLRERERLLVDRAVLERLAARLPLGIVTGRPRADAERFLRRFGIDDLFAAVVCREDAPLKPDPAPVLEACRRLGARLAWFVGDTPDDIAAARAARVLPVGVVAPGDDRAAATAALTACGAARVLVTATEIEELLP